MHIPLDPGDRQILIGTGLLLVVLTVAGLLLSPQAIPESRGFPSSYSAAHDGAKASFLLLRELGYKVERWETPPTELPTGREHTVLILAEPFVPATAAEKAQIRSFLTLGGWVLATGKVGAFLLPESGRLETKPPWPKMKRFSRQLPSPITRQAPEIELEGSVRWITQAPGHLAHFGNAEGATVVAHRVGKGQVIWWSGPAPLTNRGLTQASNLEMFLNSLGPPETTRVLWDEYFHGERPDLWSYLRRTPTPWVLLQCLVLLGGMLITYSRRSGPIRLSSTRGTRLSPLEFVETLGELYQRKHAALGALEIAYHRFRFLLLKRLGLSSSVRTEDITRSIRERLGCEDEEFVQLFGRCARAVEADRLGESESSRLFRETVPSEEETLRLVQMLHEYAERWRLLAKPAGE